MKRRRVIEFVAVGLVLGLGGRVADAGLITWQFSGVMDNVSSDFGDFPDAIEPGTPFSGTFTFDTSTPDSDTENPRTGAYPNSVTAVSGFLGDMAFVGSDSLASEFFVHDRPAGLDNDGFGVSISNVWFPIIDVSYRLQFSVADIDGSMLSDDGLPLHPPDITAPDLRSRMTFFRDPGPGAAGGPVNVLIPEPSTLALLIFGAAGFLVRKPGRSESSTRHPGVSEEKLVANRSA
jgi:hypothetical protein